VFDLHDKLIAKRNGISLKDGIRLKAGIKATVDGNNINCDNENEFLVGTTSSPRATSEPRAEDRLKAQLVRRRHSNRVLSGRLPARLRIRYAQVDVRLGAARDEA
jgi:hypothetical protein